MRGKHSTNDLFLTAKTKAANNHELTKKMIDTVEGLLSIDEDRIEIINENWHLHAGEWPEMDLRLGKTGALIPDEDSGKRNINLDDFIVHHPKMNNVSNWIVGQIIMQPLIPIVRDFSAHGRRYREAAQMERLRKHYYEQVWSPQAQMVQSRYYQENSIQDPLSLTPEEQRQVQSDLEKRYRQQIPRQVIEDLQRVNTPDEKIRQVLLNYDIEAYDILEKFIQGGEQAVVAYEEYYRVGRRGARPTLDVLQAEGVDWAGDEGVDYCEDGYMAKYEQYIGVHTFINKYANEVIKTPGMMKEVKDFFKEIPGYFRDGIGRFKDRDGDGHNESDFIDHERDFLDAIANNPDLIQNDWRTNAGQQEIAALYNSLGSHSHRGWGISEVYCTFKWTERMNYVVREEQGELKEYIFSSDYRKDPSVDKVFKQFPANRVYHGTKVADRFYVGVEPVPWQYFGGIYDYEPKLTICGRKYSRENGRDSNMTLMCPAKQYQFRYNVSASKLEELEKFDFGKIMFWNRKMRPGGWTDADMIENMYKNKNVPYEDGNPNQRNGNTRPFESVDAGSTAKMDEYRNSMDYWERAIYNAMYVNKDALGQANQYQSNALTQSNIQGSEKQLLAFYNRRRQVKERVLNYFSNISLIALLDDVEKQEILFDDFSRLHLQVNRQSIMGNMTSIFIVDDYDEAQNVKEIRAHILTMLQNGASPKEIIDYYRAKSVPEMYDIAEVAEIRNEEKMRNMQEAEAEQQKAQMQVQQQMLQLQEQFKALQDERNNQARRDVALIGSLDKQKGADSDNDGVPDSLQEMREKIASEERMQREKLAHEERMKRLERESQDKPA